jgi:zinc protease
MKRKSLNTILISLITFTVFTLNTSAKVNIPRPKEHTLENGLKVLFLHSDKLPTFSASILIPSASALNDFEGKTGAAALTANLLDKGTRSMDRSEIQGQLDFLGAEISASASFGYTVVSLAGLTRDWEQLFHLFTETILHPKFPESEFNQVKKLKADMLKTIPDSPSAILSRAFSSELFKGTPLKNPSDGRLKDIESLKLEDIKNFHKSNYSPKDAVLIVSGKFPEKDLKKDVEKAFKGWKNEGNVSTVEVSEYFKKPVKPRTIFVHKPGLSQVWISMGRYALPRKDPRFYSIRVANQIMGGSFTSRLNQHIRDDLGLTYSISSNFSFGKNMGSFSLRTFVENGKLPKMLKEISSVIDSTNKEKMITLKETESAKKYLTGVFPISIQSVDDLASVYLRGVYLGMDMDYVSQYIPSIKSVKLDEIHSVSKSFFDSSSYLRVMVGDKNKVRKKKNWEIRNIKDYL